MKYMAAPLKDIGLIYCMEKLKELMLLTEIIVILHL